MSINNQSNSEISPSTNQQINTTTSITTNQSRSEEGIEQ
jgi:hypothetical protein